MIDPKSVKFSRYDTADYLKTEGDIAAYLEAVAEDGDPALTVDAPKIVARARTMNAERRSRRMAAAKTIADRMHATQRFDPPPADEADSWVLAFYDEEDTGGQVISRGHRVWHHKDLADEWHRLRFTDEGEP